MTQKQAVQTVYDEIEELYKKLLAASGSFKPSLKDIPQLIPTIEDSKVLTELSDLVAEPIDIEDELVRRYVDLRSDSKQSTR